MNLVEANVSSSDIILEGLNWKRFSKLNDSSKSFIFSIDNIIKTNFNNAFFSLDSLKIEIIEAISLCKVLNVNFRIKEDGNASVITFFGSIIYKNNSKTCFLNFIVNLNDKTIKYFE